MWRLAAGEHGRHPCRVLNPHRPAMVLWPGPGFLDCVQILAQLNFIYTIAFPDRPEWRQQPYQATIAGVRHALIALCLRFAGDLFPLAFSLDWLKQIIPAHNFDVRELATIPIAPWGVDVIADPYTYYPDSFKPPLDFLAWGYIQEIYGGAVASELLPGCEHDMPLAANWSIRHTAVLVRQAQLPPPLGYLAEAADYLARATGNLWLDYDSDIDDDGYDGQGPIAWSPENVQALKTQYEAALVIDKQIGELMDWVAEAKESRMQQILALMQLLYAHDQKTISPPTPAAATPQPFPFTRLPAGRTGANGADPDGRAGVALPVCRPVS